MSKREVGVWEECAKLAAMAEQRCQVRESRGGEGGRRRERERERAEQRGWAGQGRAAS